MAPLLGADKSTSVNVAPLDIDGDPDLELVLQTAYSGVVTYDLPGSAQARVQWGTGRGSYLLNGVAAASDFIFADGFESGSTAAWSVAVP